MREFVAANKTFGASYNRCRLAQVIRKVRLLIWSSRVPPDRQSAILGGEVDEVTGRVLHFRVAVGVMREQKSPIPLEGRVRLGAVRVRSQVVAEEKRAALICLTDDPYMDVHAPKAGRFVKEPLSPSAFVLRPAGQVNPRCGVTESHPKTARYVAESARPALVLLDNLDGVHPRIVISARHAAQRQGHAHGNGGAERQAEHGCRGDQQHCTLPDEPEPSESRLRRPRRIAPGSGRTCGLIPGPKRPGSEQSRDWCAEERGKGHRRFPKSWVKPPLPRVVPVRGSTCRRPFRPRRSASDASGAPRQT